ncbi:hypothetical protein D9758_016067 [Tetrapyrgos nigripes]|uniref:Protein-S-isoprenylcysteine O-methyltransferase n=1 Tax=Tetrapyrgos nigripes TaxID=182062 RepID=A0A8H5C504_9AGAR|nr:hypothetical protein D9758_016067 [Tetrapyrgos nigripes]
MGKYVPVIMLILEALVVQFSHFLHQDLQSYLNANGVTSQPSTQFYIGISILFIAGFIRYRCYAELGRHFTFEISVLSQHKLITTGPYSIVRHPSYAGSCLCLVGVLLTWGSKRSLVRNLFEELYGDKQLHGMVSAVGLMVIVVLVVWTCNFSIAITILLGRMKKEDELMKREFGNQWIEWKQSVPYKLVPGVY